MRHSGKQAFVERTARTSVSLNLKKIIFTVWKRVKKNIVNNGLCACQASALPLISTRVCNVY